MKSKFAALTAALFVPAVLVWSTACSPKPDDSAASPTPAASPTAAATAVPTATPTPVAASTPATTPAPAADGKPVIYIIEGSDANLHAFDASGAPAKGFAVPSLIVQSVALDPASGTLYMAENWNKQISTYDAKTGAKKTEGFIKDATFDTPLYLAFAGGTLYVNNYRAKKFQAFDAATGAPVAKGFTPPAGLEGAEKMAVSGGTLYVVDDFKVKAFDLATGQPTAGFTAVDVGTIKSLTVSGNVLFVGYLSRMSPQKDLVGEFDAKTGAAINAKFITDAGDAWAVAVLGSNLLVKDAKAGIVHAYGLPAKAAEGNVPTSAGVQLITGFKGQNAMITAQ